MCDYALIFFDLDDTLFDFKHAQHQALLKTFEICGLRFGDEHVQQFHAINQSLWAQYERRELSKQDLFATRFTQFFQHYGHDYDGIVANTVFLEHLAAKPRLLSGAHELCEFLHHQYTLGIVTNGDSITQRRRLAASPIHHFFRFMLVSDEVGYGKPHPAIFQEALQRAGMPAGTKTLMVGDNLTADVAGAKAFGFDACWLNPHGKDAGDTQADYNIRCLSELPRVLAPRLTVAETN